MVKPDRTPVPVQLVATVAAASADTRADTPEESGAPAIRLTLTDVTESRQAAPGLQDHLAEEERARAALVSILEDHREVEQALRDSEARWQFAVEGTGDGVWDWNVPTSEVTFSRRWKEMLGFAEDEIGSGLDEWSARVHPEDLPSVMADVRAHLDGRTATYANEHRVRCKDGTWKWILDRGLIVSRDADGQPLRMIGTHSDISDRKAAQAALRATEERHRQILETSIDGFWVLDAQGRVLEVNAAYCRMIGYSASELLTMRIADLEAVQTVEEVAATVRQVVAQGEGRFEVHHRHKDGRILDLDISIQYRPDEIGCFVVFLRDISSRKHTEMALRERLKEATCLAAITSAIATEPSLETMFQRCVDLMPAGLFYPDIACARISTGDRRYQTDNFRATDWRLAADLVVSGEPVGMVELCYLEERSIRDEGQFLKEERVLLGQIASRLANAIGLQRVKSALRAKEELHLTLIETAMDGFLLVDTAGRLLDVNAAYCRMSGYSASELLTMRIADLDAVETEGVVAEHIHPIIAQGEGRFESQHRRKDGNLYDVEVSVQARSEDDGRMVCFLRDITKDKQLRAQFLQAQKMEGLGQLASGIAHDFNNLLAVINGMSTLVMGQLHQDDPVRADMQEIIRAGERAAGLTRQLLAFSRQQLLAPRVLDINAVISGMVQMLRRLLGEDVDLQVVAAADLGRIEADPGQIEQVIVNLAVNARDAMPHGGQLTIETQNTWLDKDAARQYGVTVPPGAYVQVTVSDSGTGMDEATRVRIFEPFFTTKGPGKGTGLGLSTIKGIVEQSRGGVQVLSEIGQGTRFRIVLPQVSAQETLGMVAPRVAAENHAETILLVEDSASLRRMVTRFLEPIGYAVIVAASGQEALQVLARHETPVHLLLTDVVMPGMDGRTLAERIAQTHPEMKVLYMSGYTSDTVVRHGVMEATMHLIDKPFTAAALSDKVRQVLDSTV